MVAGTSCKNFSNLNNQRNTFHQLLEQPSPEQAELFI
jgi:hypothetical protein